MNCLEHLHVCQSECCKQFFFNIDSNIRLYKGKQIILQIPSKDLAKYLEYHGCEVSNGYVVFKLNKFRKKGNHITVYKTCSKLTEEGQCSIHDTPEQPRVCFYPNKDNTGESANVHITKNCIYQRAK